MLNNYRLIKVKESFIGKEGKPINSVGFYLVDDYGVKIKIKNVFPRDYYTLSERASDEDNQ